MNNPYDLILLDEDGTLSIEWGAFGVPETFLIYKKKIIKKVIGPINLGNPVEFKISELAQMIIKLTNSKSKIVNKDLPIDDPIRRKPDISMAKKSLDWEPNVDVIDGLKETIDYFKSKI